jgi:hypothetical protein
MLLVLSQMVGDHLLTLVLRIDLWWPTEFLFDPVWVSQKVLNMGMVVLGLGIPTSQDIAQ